LPGEGITERARLDRAPYDLWIKAQQLVAVPGKSVDYEYVAIWLKRLFDRYDIRKIGFDRWNFKFLKKELITAGFTEEEVEQHFVEAGQGFQWMSPALRALESELLNGHIAHGNHPVLNMCAINSVVQTDPHNNRKLVKNKSVGRIDGMVALAMAFGVAIENDTPEPEPEFQAFVL
jgi:phage terminase large subunit-like protein